VIVVRNGVVTGLRWTARNARSSGMSVARKIEFPFLFPERYPARSRLSGKQLEERSSAADVALDALVNSLGFTAVFAHRCSDQFAHTAVAPQALSALTKHDVLDVLPGGESGSHAKDVWAETRGGWREGSVSPRRKL